MSKKPTKSRHRIPDCALELKSEPIDDRYQLQIDYSISKLERQYRKAQKALEVAEVKAERARQLAERLEAKRQEALRVAERRASEEQRLSEYIGRIKEAAKNSRIADAKADLDRKQREITARRNEQTAARKLAAKEARQREIEIRETRRRYDALFSQVLERRRELHEIEMLMIPSDYGGRDHRRRLVRHEAAAIIIPLGATTGERPKIEPTPVFPVITKHFEQEIVP